MLCILILRKANTTDGISEKCYFHWILNIYKHKYNVIVYGSICCELRIISSILVFLPQPGKLAEAFKYFVQGMGYSKWKIKKKLLICFGKQNFETCLLVGYTICLFFCCKTAFLSPDSISFPIDSVDLRFVWKASTAIEAISPQSLSTVAMKSSGWQPALR